MHRGPQVARPISSSRRSGLAPPLTWHCPALLKPPPYHLIRSPNSEPDRVASFFSPVPVSGRCFKPNDLAQQPAHAGRA